MNLIKIIIIIIISLIVYRLICRYIGCDTENLKNIDKLYVNSFITVDNKLYGDKYNLTYGEMTWKGMTNIVNYCKNKNIPINTFIDIGCGNGRTLAYASISGFKQAKGVEIVKQRYDYAVNTLQKLDPSIKSKISIENKDMFNLNKDFIPKDSVIFISNLLFPPKTTTELIKHLSNIAPASTYVILSKLPNDKVDYKLIEQIDVPMSWDRYSRCYVIKVN
jgi:SAM-dependent methyltransferase